MANVLIRKKGNILTNYMLDVTNSSVTSTFTHLTFSDTEKTVPMPAKLTDIGGVWVTLATGISTTETIKVNLYDSTGGIYKTVPVTSIMTGNIYVGNLNLKADTTIFEIVCNTSGGTPPPEKITVTKGDFATNSGKYKVEVGGVGLDPLVATLGFNDETVKVNKPKEPLDISSVRVSFSEGEVFVSGFVELYDKANTLLGTNALDYDKYTKTARYSYKYDEKTTLMKVYITFHVEVPHDETVVPTFNHVYSMQPSELDQLMVEGFGVDTPSGTIDLRTFMLNLLSFPFSIPPESIGEREKITLGGYTRKTETTALKGDIIQYNLGSIEVPLKYKNAYDFYSAETTLILPYTENVSLPPEYVIGATISVEYVVEVYKGTVNINVTSSKTGKPIYNGTTSIGRQIPFISYWKILGDESIYTSVYNNQTKAIIEVKRKQPLQLEYGTDVSEYGTIGDYTGYVEVTEVGLTGSTMGGYEQEQLLSILNKGVIL